MIVFQERNDEGRRVTAEFYSAFCSSSQQPTAIDRVSFLYGMQAFCDDQLKTELESAVGAMDGSIPKPAMHSRNRDVRRKKTQSATN